MHKRHHTTDVRPPSNLTGRGACLSRGAPAGRPPWTNAAPGLWFASYAESPDILDLCGGRRAGHAHPDADHGAIGRGREATIERHARMVGDRPARNRAGLSEQHRHSRVGALLGCRRRRRPRRVAQILQPGGRGVLSRPEHRPQPPRGVVDHVQARRRDRRELHLRVRTPGLPAAPDDVQRRTPLLQRNRSLLVHRVRVLPRSGGGCAVRSRGDPRGGGLQPRDPARRRLGAARGQRVPRVVRHRPRGAVLLLRPPLGPAESDPAVLTGLPSSVTLDRCLASSVTLDSCLASSVMLDSRLALIIFTAWSMTVSVLKPRKSNFTRPIFSISLMANCVTVSPLTPRYRGTCSVSGSLEITTPAA